MKTELRNAVMISARDLVVVGTRTIHDLPQDGWMRSMAVSRGLLATVGAVFCLMACGTLRGAEAFRPAIPKTWEDAEMASLELPLAHASASPRHVPSSYYYGIPVRPIYKSYPVYHPRHEPPGYLDQLRRMDPVVLWDDKGHRPRLKTKADWIQAGELVFDSSLGISGQGHISTSTRAALGFRDAGWYERTGTPTTKEGVMPFYRYVIREKGRVEVGLLACAMCHTRVMPDGGTLKGAQGNFPFDRVFAEDYRSDPASIGTDRLLERLLFHTPWLDPNPQAQLSQSTTEHIAAPHDAIPPGVLARHRTRSDQPVQIPDLIGVQQRRYLDRSGLQIHRGIADLMRYAALNQGGDDLSRFGDFVPAAVFAPGNALPENPADPKVQLSRYSDEQLYALALFAYSLKPPQNPNLPRTAADKSLVRRGEAVFRQEGCAKCHDPRQGYTNNKLIAAPGFDIPDPHPAQADILRTPSGTPRRIGSDPTLTVATRRGTGFYKVPSLQGVWYRGPFEHNGSCATLEDWFDPRRVRDDYVPTGWKGPPGTKARAVKGHEFGLDVPPEDRRALIAFLKVL
ncbi:MAG: hypothetical protein ACKOEQ_03660 [Verrucomicrobiota bacterium]